jgi:DNA repair protein RecN (Recombination protein N)
MPEARIEVGHKLTDPTVDGVDEIRLLFSANKGIAPKDLKQVASGGEFSRLMFCLKYVLASKSAMPTLVLDEIDSGVSGEIAIKMAKMMLKMSESHQLIVITHLPQIAAHGEEHYFVFKDNSEDKTISRIRNLNKEERILEIAKMIGGDSPTGAAFENAKELLGNRY